MLEEIVYCRYDRKHSQRYLEGSIVNKTEPNHIKKMEQKNLGTDAKESWFKGRQHNQNDWANYIRDLGKEYPIS